MSSSSSGASSAAAYDFGVGLAGSSSSSSSSSSAGSSSSTTTAAIGQQSQGMAGLVIMLAVLCFIFAYCCWGAPFCRSLCRRYCCCRALLADEATDSESGGFVSSNRSTAATRRNTSNTPDPSILATPTIILLPHGRMLVVDGTIFTQLQADTTGLDFVELGESVMRAQRNPGVNCHQLQTSQASIIEMDAETPSKDSMGSIGCFPPPTYESIYGKEETGDMPPSYSDILLHRLANLPFEIEDYSRDSKDEIEMRSLENCPHIISNPFASYNNRCNSNRRRANNERDYSSLPRNPSLQSNPLDAYYVDNELASLHARNQRRRSATTLTSSGVTTAARTRRTSCGEDTSTNTRTNDTSLSRSENVIDNRCTNSWDEISRAENASASEAENSSRVNPIYTRSRRSTTTPEVDAAVQVHRYPDPKYVADEEQRDRYSENDEVAEEEANNFKVLADIRESRV